MAIVTANSIAEQDVKLDVESKGEVSSGAVQTAAVNAGPSTTVKLILGFIALAAIVCVITIPVVLTKDNRNGSSESLVGLKPSDGGGTNDTVIPTTNTSTPTNASTPTNTSTPTFPVFAASNIKISLNGTSPFNATLEILNVNSTTGYSTEEELIAGIDNATRFFLDSVYQRNKNVTNNPEMYYGSPADSYAETDAVASDEQAPAESLDQKVQNSDYGTNNQESNVEEGDVMVSNGEYVFAAYGKYLLVWNALTGVIVKEIEMPKIILPSNDPIDDSASDAKINGETASDQMMPPYNYEPEPSIRSLVLHGDDKLLIVVGGYGQQNQPYYFDGQQDIQPRVQHALGSYQETRLFIHDIPSLIASTTNDVADAGLLSDNIFNGDFVGVRLIDDTAHLVTGSYIDTYSLLELPMQRDYNVTDDEYIDKIRKLEPQLTTAFNEQLRRDLTYNFTKSMPFLSRIALWEGQEDSSSVMSSVALVNSIKMGSSQDNADEGFSVTSSASMVPQSYFQVYGSVDKLVMAIDRWVPDGTTSTELFAFQIMPDGTSRPHSVGKVNGSIINSYALDAMGNTLRIATTVRRNNWIMFADVVGDVSPEADVSALETATAAPTSSTQNYITILEMVDGSDGKPGLMVETGSLQIGEPNESITSVRFFDNIAYAVTFERTDPLYVLNLTDIRKPAVLGELKIPGYSDYLHPINAENTLLLGVGQNADENGVVTGTQVTLFDASDPLKPVALHRYDIENQADSWSYTDASWDKNAFRYTNGYLFLPVDTYSSNSSFSGTFVLTVDKTNGIKEACVVTQMQQTYNYGSTYVEYDAGATTGIVQPSSPTTPQQCNYTGGYLPRRSMLFNGDLMTTWNSEIILTELASCQRLWNQTIGIPDPDGCEYNTYQYYD